MRKSAWKPYALGIALAEAVGAAAGLMTRGGMQLYQSTAKKPPLSPPAPVFPLAWAGLYALMGVGAARVWLSQKSPARSRALRLFGTQLAFNFGWSFLFFRFRMYGPAFFWLLILLALAAGMTRAFGKADRPAALMQIPYLLWLLFAAYLNLSVWLLNP